MIKWLTKILVCTLLILVGKAITFAQKCPKPPNNKVVEEVVKREKEAEKGWKEVKTKGITFYTPDDLKERTAQGVHGISTSYESENLFTSTDTDNAAFYPNYERSYSTYTEKVFCIDGRLVWFWSYRDNEGYTYRAGAFFYFEEDKQKRLGIYFSSKNKDIKQTAEKTVKSIEFVKPLK